MKAIISNRIYLSDPGREVANTITKALTYKFAKNTGNKQFSTIETVRTYKKLTGGVFSIPQGREDLIPENWEVVDNRIFNPVPFPDPKFELRPDQLEVYDQVVDTCFINALVGWGKTFTALHLARKLGQKTLVITHTTTLRDQWIQEVTTLFGVNPGIIGSGKFDIEDHFIVVSNIQSLKKYKDKISKEFGTIILDEAHHCPASTFTEIIDSSYARYRIALSGTLKRKDEKHKLFQDYFGFTIYKPAQANTINPIVRLVNTNRTLKPGATWADKITDLTLDDEYRQFISKVAKTYTSKGHSVLVIADRVEFLEKVAEYVGKTCVLVTGDTSFEERERAKQQLLSKEKMCVAGSRQIFSEGISINVLSCVILATPFSNEILLEQIVGRIMRPFDNKPQPIVLDMQFAGWADKKQNNDRLSFYLRKGWDISSI